MAIVSAIGGTKIMSVHAVRYPACKNCGRPNSTHVADCIQCGLPTPKPSMFDALGKPLGTIAFWHINPFKRLAWKLGRIFKESKSWLTA